MEVGGLLLFFLVVVALCFAAVAVPPMLIRWAVRQIRRKWLVASDEWREKQRMREAA